MKILSICVLALLSSSVALAQDDSYRVLATSKTSTMEKEMNQAGTDGYKFVAVMGGETAIGGKEVVVLMQKSAEVKGPFRYHLLATNRTSTMEKEMNEAAADGYDYVGQTVFESTFGGEEVVAIVERGSNTASDYIYKLIATSKTSTLEKEMNQIGPGYQAMGMTVGKTAIGGKELVVIARKKK